VAVWKSLLECDSNKFCSLSVYVTGINTLPLLHIAAVLGRFYDVTIMARFHAAGSSLINGSDDCQCLLCTEHMYSIAVAA
jgi:hypothetical protein